MPFFIGYILFFNHKGVKKLQKKVFEENFGEIVNTIKNVPLEEKQRKTFSAMIKQSAHMSVHGFASMGSTMKSMFLLKVLKSSTSDPDQAEQDYNLLMSQCNDVISAEVPNMLREIAKELLDKDKFASMSDDDALTVLQDLNGKESKAALIFKEFIKRHGHRGYREFDPLYPTWRTDSRNPVQVIKSLINGGASLEPKKETPIEEIMSQIKTPLNWFKRTLVSKFLLSWTRDAGRLIID